MYAAIDKILEYVISKGVPFIIMLILIYLIYRYFVYGQGNRTLLCPSIFGSTYDNKCLSQTKYIVDLKGDLIEKNQVYENIINN